MRRTYSVRAQSQRELPQFDKETRPPTRRHDEHPTSPRLTRRPTAPRLCSRARRPPTSRSTWCSRSAGCQECWGGVVLCSPLRPSLLNVLFSFCVCRPLLRVCDACRVPGARVPWSVHMVSWSDCDTGDAHSVGGSGTRHGVD